MNFSLNKLLSGILIFLTAAIIVLTAAFFIAGMRHPRKKAAQPVIQAAPNAQQTPIQVLGGFAPLRALQSRLLLRLSFLVRGFRIKTGTVHFMKS